MNIIILVLLFAILLLIYNNYANKEDFHNINNGYINPYIQQPILFPIYSPYRMYYPIVNNYQFIPSMYAPYYSQYNILNPNNLYYY
jgi:hypothetical protein